MSALIEFAVGESWPLAPFDDDGMRIELYFDGDVPSMILGMSVTKPDASEVNALDKPTRLAVATAKPLTWIAAGWGCLTFDAPYACTGTPEQGRLLKETLAKVATWGPETRGLVQVVLLDRGTILRQRYISLSRRWWTAFAVGVHDCPDSLPRQIYDRHVAEQSARWTTEALFERARVVEIGGAV